MGRAVFTALKALQSAGIEKCRLMAVAVREHATWKVAQVLWVMHAVPQAVSKELETGVVVQKPRTITTSTLFVGIKEPLANECRYPMYHYSFPLTIGKLYADSFTAQELKVTGTNAGLAMRYDQELFAALNIAVETAKSENSV